MLDVQDAKDRAERIVDAAIDRARAGERSVPRRFSQERRASQSPWEGSQLEPVSDRRAPGLNTLIEVVAALRILARSGERLQIRWRRDLDGCIPVWGALTANELNPVAKIARVFSERLFGKEEFPKVYPGQSIVAPSRSPATNSFTPSTEMTVAPANVSRGHLVQQPTELSLLLLARVVSLRRLFVGCF